MNTKIMYALEYNSYDGNPTFDIFETFKDAKNFAEEVKSFGYKCIPVYIFKAEFNCDRIYKEEDGSWNYEDYSDTVNFNNFNIIKHYDSSCRKN